MEGPFGMPCGPTGKRILQVVREDYGDMLNANPSTPRDDTKPQTSETTLVISKVVYPRQTGSIMLVTGAIQYTFSFSYVPLACLFVGSSTSALAVSRLPVDTTNGGGNGPVSCKYTAPDTSPITFQLRVGCEANIGYNLNLNSYGGSRLFGGVCNTFLQIIEVEQ